MTDAPEERREGYIDLAQQLADHLDHHKQVEESMRSGSMVVGKNGKTLGETWKEHDDLFRGHQQIIEVIAGKEVRDPLTGETTIEGGMRQDITSLKHQAENGGVNAKVKWTTGQKLAVTIGIPAATTVMVTVIQVVLGG